MRYYSPRVNQYSQTFTELPLDYLKNNLEQTQAKADNNRNLIDQTDLLFAKPVLDQDLAMRNQLIKEHQQRVDDALKSSNGDYSKLTPFLRDEYKRINNDLTMGRLGAMYGNYNSYVDYKKNLDDKFQKGDITTDTYKVMLTDAKRKYSGIGEGDDTGRYNSFSGNQVMNDMDLTQEGFKFFEGWKADALSNGSVKRTADGNYFLKTKSGWEKVDENELYNEGLNYFKSTPKYAEYSKQRAFVDTYNLPDQIDTQEYEYQTNPSTGKKEPVLVNKRYSKEEYQQKYQEGLIDQAARAGAEKYGYVNKSYEEDIDADPFALKSYEHDLANPTPILVGKEAPALKYGTPIDNSNAISTKVKDTESGLRGEYKQLLIAEGLPEDQANYMSINTPMDQMVQHVNVKRDSSLKGLTGKFDNLYGSYENLNLLDKEASDYAEKTTGINNNQLDNIVKQSKNPYVAKMSADDLMNFYWADRAASVGYEPLNPYYQNGTVSLKEDAATQKQQAINLKNSITQKYGFKPNDLQGSLSYNAEFDRTVDNLKKSNNKYATVKDQYLKDNSTQRLKENIVLNKNVLLTTDQYGNTIVDTKNTDAVNKQIDTYFEKGQLNDVVTEIPKGDGSYYTLAEYRAKVAEDQGLDDPNKVKVDKPWYSQYSETSVDSNGNSTTVKPMYVNVGGEAVKINQNQLYVNTGDGLIPLSQMNNTPQNATESWLANTASYGVREKPIELNGGAKVVVSNARTANNYANGSDLKVTFYNPDGTQRGVLVGPQAFNYLTNLQTQGKLK